MPTPESMATTTLSSPDTKSLSAGRSAGVATPRSGAADYRHRNWLGNLLGAGANTEGGRELSVTRTMRMDSRRNSVAAGRSHIRGAERAESASRRFVCRKRATAHGARYRVPGYPWTPLLFIATVAAVLVNTIVAQPARAGIGIGVVLTGGPAYLIWRKG